MIDGQPIACFQPFIDTATGLIAGVEALGRLRQDNGDLQSVGPLFFNPRVGLAELRRLDRQIRDAALARIHEAPKDWFLSLNISPRWISRLRPNQPLPSLKQLQQQGVPPERVVFEITELGGAHQRLPEVVARYRDAGARIAIDDFGAGYSQLDRVLALQPDILKLDMRLFQEAARGGPSGEVVKALAQMAEKTGCWIIAEGVETEEEMDFALECGARYVQGYLFAKPALEFPASDAFRAAFAQRRDHYVNRKLRERANLIQLRQQLSELMNMLRPGPKAAPCSAACHQRRSPSAACCAFTSATATAPRPRQTWSGTACSGRKTAATWGTTGPGVRTSTNCSPRAGKNAA